MSRITISKKNYKFQHYDKNPVKLTPYNGGYSRKLFKDQYYRVSKNLIIPDNVSDLIYGKI